MIGPDREVLTLEEDQMQDHEHDISDPGHTHPYTDQYHRVEAQIKHGESNYASYPLDTSNKVTSSKTTGVRVTGVSSSFRHGDETRPKNMNVIYIIRVY